MKKHLISCLLLLLLQGAGSGQNWLNQLGNLNLLVNDNAILQPPIPGMFQLGDLQEEQQMPCFSSFCFTLNDDAPALYSNDFYQHQNDEATFAGFWMNYWQVNNMPYDVRQAFDWFLNTWYQPVQAYAPQNVQVKFSHRKPFYIPGVANVYAVLAVEKTILISN
ncbi:MAG: hypothetical protein EPO28_02545 [Saprospiraceae bacterium]|nr:MAG: hypothetical protein EPO28_02545 [Saprospiraceae bacterium]